MKENIQKPDFASKWQDGGVRYASGLSDPLRKKGIQSKRDQGAKTITLNESRTISY
eukprot:CAMPEP_0113592588 /NCGR_PEP_ID=MMETSP0015_2-20120614/37930_1 /TAXON_ID=2838 /ORGANISM="Odontella" /LENGTH=55 /DNA_ID=CAMNT_0000499141 /DNA_START=43 /DNA_END=207 /DNA_ORIENTATION=+ /assembly_acc=CAM_ASM_000160